MSLQNSLPPAELSHCRRTAALSKLLAGLAGYSESEVRTITQSALVHDIGKMGIPSAVLYKPGPLSPEERVLIQTHTTIGAKILTHTRGAMRTAAVVALQHHERLDGSGYLGLRDAEIHPHAKIVAVADIFDALISPRPYKRPWDIRLAGDYLKERAGVELDGDIVRLLLANTKQILDLYHSGPRINSIIRISPAYAHRERRKTDPCCYRKSSTSSIG